jgi:diguanylate cyclase
MADPRSTRGGDEQAPRPATAALRELPRAEVLERVVRPESKTVLHLEDNDNFAALIAALLETEQIEVRRARDLATGCAIATDDQLLGAFIDLDLPDAGGLQSVIELRRANPALPIVVLSGKDGALAVKAVSLGAHEWLPKDQVDAPRLARSLELAISRQNAELAMVWAAMHDVLTGLPGRALACEHLTRSLSRARRHGTLVAVLFADLDRFKAINDRLGHAAGDHVLADVARRLVASVRPHDLVARWGGDEFVVIADSLGDVEEARHLADRLRDGTAKPLPHTQGPLIVEVTVGVAIGRDAQPNELVEQADLAMLRGKRDGTGIAVMPPGGFARDGAA